MHPNNQNVLNFNEATHKSGKILTDIEKRDSFCSKLESPSCSTSQVFNDKDSKFSVKFAFF